MRFSTPAQPSGLGGFGQLAYALGAMPAMKQQWAQQAQQEQAKQDLIFAQTQEHQSRNDLTQRKIKAADAEAAMQTLPEMLASAFMARGAPASEAQGLASYAQTGVRPAAYQTPADGVGPMPENTKYYDDAGLIAQATKLAGMGRMGLANGGNIHQVTQALGDLQGQGYTADAVAAAKRGDNMSAGAIGAANRGATFTPFKAMGATGQALNEVTGQAQLASPVLAQLFGAESTSKTDENKAQATQARAAAGASSALAGLRGVQTTNEKVRGGILAQDLTDVLEGNAPTSKQKASRAADSTNAKLENDIYRTMMKSPQWANATDAEFSAELERRKNLTPAASGAKPAAAASTKVDEAPANALQRKAGTIYNTPRGAMKWTGTGWLPAN